MKTIRFIGAVVALALVPATAFAAADCCPDKTCCKDGADCCKDGADCCKDGADCCKDGKGDCCKDMKKGGDHAGHDMSGMKMPMK